MRVLATSNQHSARCQRHDWDASHSDARDRGIDRELRGASHNEPAPLSLLVLTTAGGLLRPSPSHLVSLSREQLSGAALITEAVSHSPRLGLREPPAPAAYRFSSPFVVKKKGEHRTGVPTVELSDF